METIEDQSLRNLATIESLTGSKGVLYGNLSTFLIGVENISTYDLGISKVCIKIRFGIVGYESCCFRVMEIKLGFWDTS